MPLFPEHKLGLALGGGAARGIAHIGVLKAFVRENIPISFMSGASSGAMVAALFASGIPIPALEKIARSMHMVEFTRFAPFQPGLASTAAIADFLRQNKVKDDFSQLSIPLAVATTKLSTGNGIIFKEGSVIDAVCASSAFPGIYAPLKIGDELFVDANISDNIPVDVLKEMGATLTVAIDVLPQVTYSAHPKNPLEVLDWTYNHLVEKLSAPSRKKADFVITPLHEYIGFMDFNKGEKLLSLGEKAAQKVIPRIKEKLKKKRLPFALPF